MSTKTPDQHKEQLRELDSRYEIAIREVTSSFPNAMAYNTISTYTNVYEKNKTNLDELNKDLFLEKDSLQNDILTVESNIADVIKKITEVEKENAKLMVKLQDLDNQREGAIGMYNDSKYWYNVYRGENFFYFIAICALVFGIYKNNSI